MKAFSVGAANGLQDIAEDDQLGAEFMSAVAALDELCAR
jgi:hypothetical protein